MTKMLMDSFFFFGGGGGWVALFLLLLGWVDGGVEEGVLRKKSSDFISVQVRLCKYLQVPCNTF